MGKPYQLVSRNIEQNEPFVLTDEKIAASALVRIADATELMAKNYIKMQDDLEYYKRAYHRTRDESEAKDRRISSLRGVITRMKNKSSKAN